MGESNYDFSHLKNFFKASEIKLLFFSQKNKYVNLVRKERVKKIMNSFFFKLIAGH